MLWTLLLGLALNDKVVPQAYGYYQDYPQDTTANNQFARFFYSSSPQLPNSNYIQSNDQYPAASSNTMAYSLPQPEQDTSSSYKIASYANSIDSNYPRAEEYHYPSAPEEQSYQPFPYDHGSQSLLPSYQEPEANKLDAPQTSAEVQSNLSHHQLPHQTIHFNSDLAPANQHFQISRQVPIPVFKPIHVPVARPVRVEVPHPIIVPVPKPYPIKVPVVQPVAVPLVKEISLPVERIVPYPVEKKVPYTVEKHVPYKVEKHVTVQVPHLYPVRVPIIKTIVHRVKTFGRLNVPTIGWN